MLRIALHRVYFILYHDVAYFILVPISLPLSSSHTQSLIYPRERGLTPTPGCYAVALNALEKEAEWQKAVNLLLQVSQFLLAALSSSSSLSPSQIIFTFLFCHHYFFLLHIHIHLFISLYPSLYLRCKQEVF